VDGERSVYQTPALERREMTSLLERLSSAALGVAALAVAAVLVHREFSGQPARSALRHESGRVAEWRDALDVGHVIGDSAAPLRLIEFADLECPFCRQFHGTAQAVLAKHSKDVALVYVHTPIASHRFAEPAARAAECAFLQGRFESFLDRVYARQDSLGLKSWVSFARDAGVVDTIPFAKCVAANLPTPAIARGTALAKRLRIEGTPTVLLNDWRFGSPPTEQELETAIDTILSRKPRRPNQ